MARKKFGDVVVLLPGITGSVLAKDGKDVWAVSPAAHRLEEQAPRWLAQWRASSGNADAKLVLVAHSMGGLVARHYLEVLGGWRDTRHLITFGTPYRGSLNAVEFLANGMRKGWGPFSVDVSDLLRSLTSVYQLLPIYPSVRPAAGRPAARVAETDVPHVDRSRAQQALRFHRDIEAVQTRNAQDDAYVREGYACSPLVGILQVTAQSGTVQGDRVVTVPQYDGEDDGGDGTVPRVVPDLVQPEEAVPVRASTAGAAGSVRVTATDVGTGRVVRSRAPRRRRVGSFSAELAPMPEGVYRVTVVPGDDSGVNPNTELLTVLAPESAEAGIPTRRR